MERAYSCGEFGIARTSWNFVLLWHSRFACSLQREAIPTRGRGKGHAFPTSSRGALCYVGKEWKVDSKKDISSPMNEAKTWTDEWLFQCGMSPVDMGRYCCSIETTLIFCSSLISLSVPHCLPLRIGGTVDAKYYWWCVQSLIRIRIIPLITVKGRIVRAMNLHCGHNQTASISHDCRSCGLITHPRINLKFIEFYESLSNRFTTELHMKSISFFWREHPPFRR